MLTTVHACICTCVFNYVLECESGFACVWGGANEVWSEMHGYYIVYIDDCMPN